jgi:pyruvate,orthophosphate dikinase
VFCSLYGKALDEVSPVALRETAARNFLYYLEKVARESEDALPRLVTALGRALHRLDETFERTPQLAVSTSPRLRRLAEAVLASALEPAAEVPERSLALLASALRRVYEHWLRGPDPADWWREQMGSDATPLPDALAAISHERLQEHLARLDAICSEAGLVASHEPLLALPDDAQIQRGYLDAAFCVGSETAERWRNQLERIHWLIKVLSVESLTSVHEPALSEISHSCLDVLRGADRDALEPFVREMFAILRSAELAASPNAFNLISKIGLEVLSTEDPDWVDVAVDEILDWDFPNPEFSGFTDEWQVRVNPAHLRAIRTYLTLIERDPPLARRLIAALVVHLKIGGVFIADTDLFQKDVTELLNSRIGPVYHQTKRLLKLFPVYFNDIGAEGELRDVSSRIDEIGKRRDPLCHFLRKQCHVESNPRLIDFIEAVARFWATGDRGVVRPYVPESLYEQLDIGAEECAGVHRVFAELAGSEDVGALFELEAPQLERRLKEVSEGRAVDREKAELLFTLRRLVGCKYELDHEGLLERLDAFPRIAREEVEALRRALSDGEHEAALEVLIGVLEQLKRVVVSEERTEGIEDIYRKRHIAVGIPSIYGRYREEKFEAMGLTFRIESLANALFERMLSERNFDYITRNTLQRVLKWLRLFLRALRVDGCQGRGLSTGIAMLDQALLAEGISVDQYINIFQYLSRSVENLIRIRFLDVYESVLERIPRRMLDRGALPVEAGSDEAEAVLKVSEEFLRGLIAESFGLQQLDGLVARVLRALLQDREKLDRDTLNLLMTYDANRACVPLGPEEGPHDGTIYLGNKGYMIKRLAQAGLPVPDGFILTTEVFRCRAAILASEELRRDFEEQVRRQIMRLEQVTGNRFGDPRRPLLVSVRSGAAISMPGVLDTFLNVGMNVEVAEGFAAASGSPWAAWDAYRRFLQLWGMGHGIDRDRFDGLIREAKHKFGAAKKSLLPADKMRELALLYRALLLDHGVTIVEDPFEQVRTCVDLVLRSWHTEKARIYRSVLQIAEEWGTAVIVQSMVYGNLNARSGTGVALTCDPRKTSDKVNLYGDFVVQGQGDDVVAGLVETFPISESQRLSESKRTSTSLEKDFAGIYRELLRHARLLIDEQGMFHQEIEFTFESEDPADLYVLQTRDTVLSQVTLVPAFVPSEALVEAKVATGIGAGGGALSGRVAHTATDIEELRRRFPEDAIVLVRPDTVPDDIPLLLQADGMVTAVGGATSHAALVAQRLGRTCVVGCRKLQVFEAERRSELAGQGIGTGDLISINGVDGSVYLGKHPVTMVRRRRVS